MRLGCKISKVTMAQWVSIVRSQRSKGQQVDELSDTWRLLIGQNECIGARLDNVRSVGLENFEGRQRNEVYNLTTETFHKISGLNEMFYDHATESSS